MTNDRKMMGERPNGAVTKLLGWTTVAVTAAATIAPAVSWLGGL